MAMYKNVQTMDDKADLVNKLLSFLFGEVQQQQEWRTTSDANLIEVQETRFRFFFRISDITNRPQKSRFSAGG